MYTITANMPQNTHLIMISAAIVASLCNRATAYNNGVGRIPALGWSSWNWYTNDINESVIENIVHEIADSGLASLGYRYVNLDAGVWLPNRSSDGKLQPDPKKFPRGLNYLNSAMRGAGIQLGLYTDLSSRSVGKVCGTGPGSFGHFEEDASSIVEYGAGFVKVDYCAYDWNGAHVPDLNSSLTYFRQFRDAFNKTGTSIFLYFCPRSVPPKNVSTAPSSPIIDGPPLNWTATTRQGLANSLLTEYHNSQDNWNSAMSNLDALLGLADPGWNEPGYWQDADMLHTCNFGMGQKGGGMTMNEYSAQFAVWAILASNMIISAVPSAVAAHFPECLDLLKNKEILAINQDLAGYAPQLLFQHSPAGKKVTTSSILDQGFARKLQDESIAVVLLNRECKTNQSSSCAMHITWTQIGIPSNVKCNVRDVLNHKDLGLHTENFSTIVQTHSAVALRINCATSKYS